MVFAFTDKISCITKQKIFVQWLESLQNQAKYTTGLFSKSSIEVSFSAESETQSARTELFRGNSQGKLQKKLKTVSTSNATVRGSFASLNEKNFLSRRARMKTFPVEGRAKLNEHFITKWEQSTTTDSRKVSGKNERECSLLLQSPSCSYFACVFVSCLNYERREQHNTLHSLSLSFPAVLWRHVLTTAEFVSVLQIWRSHNVSWDQNVLVIYSLSLKIANFIGADRRLDAARASLSCPTPTGMNQARAKVNPTPACHGSEWLKFLQNRWHQPGHCTGMPKKAPTPSRPTFSFCRATNPASAFIRKHSKQHKDNFTVTIEINIGSSHHIQINQPHVKTAELQV